MNKQTLARWATQVKSTVVRKSPEILTGIGIAGMVTTTILAVSATPKALRLLENAQEEKGDFLTKTETVKACWKCYIPSAVIGGVSIACLIGSTSVSTRRNAALAAAYTLSDSALREYKDKVVETIGEKKEQVIRDKVAEEQIKNHPITNNEIFITEKGNTTCLDMLSGRYFKSDIDKIKKIQNELNHRLMNEMYLSLNEFYDEIGLPHIDIGDMIGWTSDRLIDIDFSAQLDEEEKPCIVLNYPVAPKYGFDRIG